MDKTVLKCFVDELIKISNTNVDGASNKNINSTRKPRKVPLSKGAPSIAAKNAVPKVKVVKPKIPKYSFFKGADDPSKKPDPKPELRNANQKLLKVKAILAKYPEPPDSLKGDDARMDWRLDQKWHKDDMKNILEAQNEHQLLQVNSARMDSIPGDSLTYRQFFNFKGKGAK